MFQYSSKSLFSRVREEFKIVFLLIVFAAAFLTTNVMLLLCLFAFLTGLLAVSGYRDFFKLFAGLLPFLALADIGFLIFLSDTSINILQLTLSSNLRILCLFTATAFFTFSTDVFALLKLLRKMHFPEAVYLPIYVLFRFLPEIEHDLVEIAAIQKLKGITKRKPVLYLKSVLIPLLFTVLQKADDLAIAYYLRKKRESGSACINNV